MGNSQKSPKIMASNKSLLYMLPQKEIMDATMVDSSFNELDQKFLNVEENKLTCRTSLGSPEGEQLKLIIEKEKNIQTVEVEQWRQSSNQIVLTKLPQFKSQNILRLLLEYQSPSSHNFSTLNSQQIIQYQPNEKCQQDTTVIYQGQWLKQQRDGFGICIYPDGSVYLGNWINDEKEGHGRQIHENGDHYTGFWKQGKYNGNGIKKTGDTFYEGDWLDGEKDGQGVEIKGNKSKYEGQYRRGKKNGFGIIKYCDNSWYKGEFLNNQYDGQGEYHWIDGRNYIGEWKNNKMDGEGILTNKNNEIYKGCFAKDKKDGIGMFKWNDGTVLKGIWKNGQLEGQATITQHDGESQIIQYKNGVRINVMQ